MPTVAVDGCDLYYEETGAGPGILFLHGLVTDAGTWDGQVARLAPAFRCVAYDRRGSTRSNRGDAYWGPVERHVRDAAALIRALGMHGCTLVVSSLGGVVGLELIRRFPELLGRAVFSEPALFFLAADAGASFLAGTADAVKRALEHYGSDAAVDRFALEMDPEAWEVTPEEERARMRANSKVMFGAFQASPYRMEASEIAAISVPAIVLRGDRSPKAFRAAAERLSTLLPRAELIEVGDAGHLLYLHQADEFARVVARFAAGQIVPPEKPSVAQPVPAESKRS